jgi:hypothetical protein
VKPRTARRSIGTHTSQPAACIRGPAMPAKRTSGRRSRIALISVAASASPDASPATIPTVIGGAPCEASRIGSSSCGVGRYRI